MKRETFAVHLSTPTRPKNLSGVKKLAIFDRATHMKIYRVKTKGTVVVKKVWCIFKGGDDRGGCRLPTDPSSNQLTFWTRKIMRAGTCHPFFCSAVYSCCEDNSAFVRVRVEPASLLQPICYKQEMEALFLVWFQYNQSLRSQMHLLRNPTFHSFFLC